MDSHTISLVTIPIFSGAIGYATNWSGVWMLFYPVRFAGFRLAGLAVARPPAAAQAPADPGRDAGRRGLAGDHPLARGEDGVDRGGQGDREARQPRRLLRAARARQDRRAHPGDLGARHPRPGGAHHGARAPAAVARRAAAGARDGAPARARPAAGDRARGDRPDRRERRSAARHQADGDPPPRGAPGARQQDLPARPGARSCASSSTSASSSASCSASPRSCSSRRCPTGGCCRSPARWSATPPTGSRSG